MIVAETRWAVYLDANPLIYAVEREPAAAEPMQALLRALGERPGMAVTSELTLGEIMVGVEKRADAQLKRTYRKLLIGSGLFDLRPVSRGILLQAARYRAVAYPDAAEPRQDRRNYYPDAVHIVTALEARCRYFVTGDDRIRLAQGLTRVETDQASIDQLIKAST